MRREYESEVPQLAERWENLLRMARNFGYEDIVRYMELYPRKISEVLGVTKIFFS